MKEAKTKALKGLIDKLLTMPYEKPEKEEKKKDGVLEIEIVSVGKMPKVKKED